MKVTNNKIGLATPKLDTTKTGKTPGAEGLAANTPAGAGAKAMKAENVAVSDRAQMMAKAKEIASRDTIDEAKVARLQKLIDEGKYKTDAAAIADRLVDAHLEIPD